MGRLLQGKALWFTSEREVELRAEEVPPPGPGDVTVESEVSLISAGTEMLVYRGETTGPEDLVLERPGRAGTYPFPVKYGYQLVGRVLAAGGNSGFDEGDRVFVQHPHQDLLTIPVRGGLSGAVMPLESVFRIPDRISSDQASLAHLFSVALNVLLDAPVRFGETVAISGLGIIGIFVAFLARRTAGRVVLIEPNARRRELAKFLDVDAIVAPDDAASAIDRATGGRGVDLFFEVSGAPSALRGALAGMAREGTIVVASNYGTRPVELRLSPDFHNKRLRIVSSQAGGIPAELLPRWSRQRRMDVAFEQLAAADFSALIGRRVPFEDAAEAYRLLDDPQGEALGVLLTYANQSHR